MQRVLRSEKNTSMYSATKDVLQDLGDSIYHNISMEFKQWEIQVVNALVPMISSMDSDLEDDESGIERHFVLAEDLHKSLTLISKGAVRAARRKSINRRKVGSKFALFEFIIL